MPWSGPDPKHRFGYGPTIWRGLIVLLMVVVVGLTVSVIALFNVNHDSIERGKKAIAQNRELGCRIGAFLVGIPIVKQPGTSQKTFEHSVVAAEDFLHSLKALQCKGLGQVTTKTINKSLKQLNKIVPEGGGGPTANAPPSPSGGGPSGPSPSPPTPGPPPGTPPPTTPPPTVPPPTVPPPPPVLRRVCHIDPILGRVCRLIPVLMFLP